MPLWTQLATPLIRTLSHPARFFLLLGSNDQAQCVPKKLTTGQRLSYDRAEEIGELPVLIHQISQV